MWRKCDNFLPPPLVELLTVNGKEKQRLPLILPCSSSRRCDTTPCILSLWTHIWMTEHCKNKETIHSLPGFFRNLMVLMNFKSTHTFWACGTPPSPGIRVLKSKLSWTEHITFVHGTCSHMIGVLCRLRRRLQQNPALAQEDIIREAYPGENWTKTIQAVYFQVVILSFEVCTLVNAHGGVFYIFFLFLQKWETDQMWLRA